MLTPRIRGALALLAASAGLAGCTNLGPYGGVGVGVGVGSNPYGYGTYGYDPYYAGYGYGSEFGYNPYGWYNGYYYPGAGYWVYDRDRNRRALTAAERAYWRARMIQYIRARRGLDGATSTASSTENWSGFERQSAAARASTADRDQARAQVRQRAIEQRAARQQAQAEREQVRSERQEIRRQAVQEQRESRRVRRGSSDE